MKKSKAKKQHRRPTALARTKNELLSVKMQLGNAQFNIQARDADIERLRAQLDVRTKEGHSLQETIAQKNAAIQVRDARIGEITAERDRVLRLVDQFTSVQITTHGTELRVSSNAASSPAALRSGQKDVVTKADPVVTAAAQEEKRREEVAKAYRSSIFTGVAKRAEPEREVMVDLGTISKRLFPNLFPR